MKKLLSLAAGLCAAASALAAPSLFTSNGQSIVMQGDPQVGQFTFLAACLSQATSITQNANELLMGDGNGRVVRFNLVSGAFVGEFTLPFGVHGMTMAGDDLMIAGGWGRVLRVNPVSGAVLETRQLPQANADANAIAVIGDKVYVGGLSTFVYKGNVSGGGFTLLTVCGGQVNSMGVAGGELLLGTDDRLYRVSEQTGAYYGVTPLSFEATSIATLGNDVFFGSSDGLVRRVNQTTGAVLATLNTGMTPVAAVAIGGVIPCFADIKSDGWLNALDFRDFLQTFQRGSMRADADNNGQLNALDFSAFLNLYIAGCP